MLNHDKLDLNHDKLDLNPASVTIFFGPFAACFFSAHVCVVPLEEKGSLIQNRFRV